MGEKENTFAEIHRLIDEQMEILKGKVRADVVVEYVRGKQRIDELLLRVSKEDFAK